MPLGYEAAAKVGHDTSEAGGTDDQEREEDLACRDFRDRWNDAPNGLESGFVTASLMALGVVPLETVDHARLGHAKRKPILHILL
jgi:hypothetical protein